MTPTLQACTHVTELEHGENIHCQVTKQQRHIWPQLVNWTTDQIAAARNTVPVWPTASTDSLSSDCLWRMILKCKTILLLQLTTSLRNIRRYHRVRLSKFPPGIGQLQPMIVLIFPTPVCSWPTPQWVMIIVNRCPICLNDDQLADSLSTEISWLTITASEIPTEDLVWLTITALEIPI